MNGNPHSEAGAPEIEARREHEQLVARHLSDPAKQEAVEWLTGGNMEYKRTVGRYETNRDSLKFVQEIYDLGVSEVLAVQIHSMRGEKGQRTGKLIVKLPTDSKARHTIFEWCRRQRDSLGFSPDPDRGESHLFLLLD